MGPFMRFFKICIALYVLSLHVILSIIILKPEMAEKIYKQLYERRQEFKFGDHFHDMATFHRRVDKNVPNGAVVFVGDSMTQGLAVSAVAPVSVNFGIGGDTTEGVLHRMDSLHSLKKSSVVVLAIGINDLKYRSDEAIVASYKKIIQAMNEHSPVLVSAILPVDEEILLKPGYNSRIEKLNKEISIICHRHRNCAYLDMRPDLINEIGQLGTNYHLGDGIHLNAEGYEIWIKGLKAALLRVLER